MTSEAVLPSATIWFEEPDILVVKVTADIVDGETVAAFAKVASELFAQRRDIYWISLNGKAKGLTEDAKAVVKNIPVLRPYAYVGVVESFITRTWVQVLMRALVLMGRFSGKVVLFATEEQARLWIAQDRRTRDASATSLIG